MVFKFIGRTIVAAALVGGGFVGGYFAGYSRGYDQGRIEEKIEMQHEDSRHESGLQDNLKENYKGRDDDKGLDGRVADKDGEKLSRSYSTIDRYLHNDMHVDMS